jgi:Gpi18-like mannosyltransferase
VDPRPGLDPDAASGAALQPAKERPVTSVGRVVGPHLTLLLVAGVALALALRIALLHGENEDTGVFTVWLDHLQRFGVADFLSTEFRTNYTPLYLYQLVVGNWLFPGSADLLVLKYLPIACDVLAAVFAWKIVRLRHPRGNLPALAFLVVLLAPTVVLNGSYWGQIDSVWTAWLLACVYFLLVRREALAFLSYGVALAVKVQAVFLLPLLVALALRRYVRWRMFALVPAVYLVTLVPALLAGRSFGSLVDLYREQAGYFGELTLNAPNLYAWIPERFSDRLDGPATVAALLVLGLATLAAARYPRRLDAEAILLLATFSVLLAPFLLPHMHERYFYAADVLTIVLAFYRPRWAFVAVLVQLASLLSYWPFLFRHDAVPLAVLALVETAALVSLCVLAVRLVRARTASPLR